MTQPVVVVTGGSRGIGRAVCQRFARQGARVVAAARNIEELTETRISIEAAGGACRTHVLDAGSHGEIEKMIALLVQDWGRIDILINNAGMAPRSDIDTMDPAIFESMMHVNVHAVFHACRCVWPLMKAHGGGVIVNVSSIAAFDPFPGFAAYGASKAWVNALTRGLSEEGRPHGIRVYAVAPGAVETRMLRGPFPDFPSEQTLDPADVANLIHLLTEPECRYSSGQVISIRR